MKYAKEIIELMAPYPERDWRAREIVNYVMSRNAAADRHNVRVATVRILRKLSEQGAVLIRPARGSGGFAEYRWRGER